MATPQGLEKQVAHDTRKTQASLHSLHSRFSGTACQGESPSQRVGLKNSVALRALREIRPLPSEKELRISPTNFLRKKSVLFVVLNHDKGNDLKHVDHIFIT